MVGGKIILSPGEGVGVFWLDGGNIPNDWFDGAPVNGSGIWVGDVFSSGRDVAHGGYEAVPFVFGRHRYIMYFAKLGGEVPGDTDEEVREFIRPWVGDLAVDLDNARLIKFVRADATHRHSIFDRDAWKLDRPRQIFEFGELLVNLVVYHNSMANDVAQYFFSPAQGLRSFYDRICKVSSDEILGSGFVAIESDGLDDAGYYGYEKRI